MVGFGLPPGGVRDWLRELGCSMRGCEVGAGGSGYIDDRRRGCSKPGARERAASASCAVCVPVVGGQEILVGRSDDLSG